MKKKNERKNTLKQKRILKKIKQLSFLVLPFIIIFCFCKEISYNPPEPYTIAPGFIKEVNSQKSPLGHYYIDFSQRKYLSKRVNKEATFDRQGVPLFRKYYHPVYICQYTLGAFEYYLNTADKNALEDFLACATWLKNNLKEHNGFFYWEYASKLEKVLQFYCELFVKPGKRITYLRQGRR